MQSHLIKNSFNDYRQMQGINSSALKVFIKNPKRYYMMYISKELNQDSDSRPLIFGRAVHTMILEPHLFSSEFIVGDYRYTTKAGQNNLALAQATGKSIVSDSELEMINYFTEELPHHYEWYKYESVAMNTYNEITIIITIYGVTLKIRIDKMFELVDKIIVYDLKSTSAEDDAGFQAAISDFDYLIQYAFYRFVLEQFFYKPVEFCFTFLSKGETRDIAFIWVEDEHYYDLGFKVVHTAINRLQTAINTNQWKANNSRKMSLNLKPWQLEKYAKYIEEK